MFFRQGAACVRGSFGGRLKDGVWVIARVFHSNSVFEARSIIFSASITWI